MTKRKAPWTTKQEILMVLNSFLENDAMRSLDSRLINMKTQRDKERLRRLMQELRSKENVYLTRSFMEENGFKKYDSGSTIDTIYSLTDTDFRERPSHAIVFSALDRTIAFVRYFGSGGMQYTVVREIDTVADLEDILELLGIEKQLKLY